MSYTHTQLEASSVKSNILKKSQFKLKFANTKNITINIKKFISKPKLSILHLPLLLFVGFGLCYVYLAFESEKKTILPTVNEVYKIQPSSSNGIILKLTQSLPHKP